METLAVNDWSRNGTHPRKLRRRRQRTKNRHRRRHIKNVAQLQVAVIEEPSIAALGTLPKRRKRNRKRLKPHDDDVQMEKTETPRVTSEIGAIGSDSANIESSNGHHERRLHRKRRRLDSDVDDHDAEMRIEVIDVNEGNRQRKKKKGKKSRSERETRETDEQLEIKDPDDERTKHPISTCRCPEMTNTEKAAIGPIWKEKEKSEEDLEADLDYSSAEDEELRKYSCHNGNDDMWELSDDSDELDRENPFKYQQRSHFLLPNIDKKDLEPVNAEEMEHVLQVHIKVDWELPPLHTRRIFLNGSAQYELEKESQEAGISVRKGRYSLQERRIVIANLEEFRKLYGIRNPLYHMGRCKSDLPEIEKTKFIQFVGRGLESRSLFSVYYLLRTMFRPYLRRIKFTEKRLMLIKNFVKHNGRKWMMLSKKMKLNDNNLHNAYDSCMNNCRKGPWTNKEYRRLIAAIVAITGERDLRKVHHSLPWTKVSQIVRTRDCHSCRTVWVFLISRLLFCKDPKKWRAEDSACLIEMMYEGQYDNELDIPWSDMYPAFGLNNCFQLSHQWATLRFNVPGYHLRTTLEQIEYLHEHVLPVIKASITCKKERRAAKSKDSDRTKKLPQHKEKSCATAEVEEQHKNFDQPKS